MRTLRLGLFLAAKKVDFCKMVPIWGKCGEARGSEGAREGSGEFLGDT
jgi:hypothetical protein